MLPLNGVIAPTGGGGGGDVAAHEADTTNIHGIADTSLLALGVASAVDNELALFSGTGGKQLKRASTTGLIKATSGVIGAAVAGTDYGRYEYLVRHCTSTSRVSSMRRYFSPQPGNNTLVVTANRLYVQSVLASSGSLYSLAAWVTASVASTNLRIGLWASGSDNLPTGSPLYDSGNISTASTGKREYVLASPFSWTPGTQYHIGVCFSGAPTVRANTTNTTTSAQLMTGGPYGLDGTDDTTINTNYKSIYVAHTFGALPDLTASNFTQYDITILAGYSVNA